MNNPLVSIIIPTFNRESTIHDCLDSVCKQTYSNIEVLVVDDCSTDNTKEIILNYNDPRVKYYRLPHNSGACIARNTGVEIATGEFVAFQDSDDIWHADKLEKQMLFIQEGNYEFVTCGFLRNRNGTNKLLGYKNIGTDMDEIYCKLLDGNWVSTQTIVCYKYCFKQISFDKYVKRFQDWDLALQAAKVFRIGALHEYLVDVFVQEDSITAKIKAYDSMKYILDKQESYIMNCNKKVIAQYYKSLGDVERMNHPLKAIKQYFKSLKNEFNPRIVAVVIMCATGLIRLYDRKYM